VLDLGSERQCECRKRRDQSAEQRNSAKEPNPVVFGGAGASDGIRHGEYRGRSQDRDCDGCCNPDSPPGETGMHTIATRGHESLS
jgi:hypothetical protein